MKRRVEACHLRQLPIALLQCLDEFDFARQMLGVERNDSLELIEQFLSDQFRVDMQHAMHHPVSHPVDALELRLGLQPIHQIPDRRSLDIDLDALGRTAVA